MRSGGATQVARSVAHLFVILIFGSAALAQSGRSVTITNNNALSFGSLTGSAAGTVTIAPVGTRTATGVFPVGASFGPAVFTVSVTMGNPRYLITLPATTTLTSPSGASMVVDTFRSLPAGSGSVQPPGRTETLSVGATLRVNPNQPAGSYSGVFQVVVNL